MIKKTLKQRGVIVAFDTRFNSEMLARVVASVLSNKNISVFLYSIPCPTPQLGFSVLTRNALAGIVITASHNSKEYNGYKIYDQNGSQIAPEVVNEILPYIEKINDYTKINFNFNKDNIFLY